MADSKELPALAIIEKKNFYMALCLKTFIKGLTVTLWKPLRSNLHNLEETVNFQRPASESRQGT